MQYVKRALYDANSQEGIDNIVAAFTFEEHKLTAARALNSVRKNKITNYLIGSIFEKMSIEFNKKLRKIYKVPQIQNVREYYFLPFFSNFLVE